MSTTGSKVLSKMLDRLLAGLMSGPNMNCRPHNSRQRIDLSALTKLADISPERALLDLLESEKCAKVLARVKVPRKATSDDDHEKTPAEKAWIDQSNLLNKLRVIADDARTYENDTGVHALSIGFPILCLPPGSFGSGNRNATKRILAPIAFIPVTLALKGGATPSVELACRGEGTDRVIPNTALLSWIEQQTGKPQPPDAFEDEEGTDPWREITELVKHVADAMRLTAPHTSSFSGRPEGAPVDVSTEETKPPTENSATEHPAAEPSGSLLRGESNVSSVQLILQPAPRGDSETDQPAILLSAVLGLFPTSHQGLLRDTRAMVAETAPLTGPIQNFLSSGVDFDAPSTPTAAATQSISPRTITSERLAAAADPCQARAVALAREAAGLVIHGPPGTGKSQTITNIIADHLARGQRVLLVCDKRTALDVVADRLDHMGLRSLCGIVHDPQRDQRDLYRSIHQQLDELADAKLYPRAEASLQKIDTELQQLHDELTTFQKSLMEPAADGGPAFHELMGRWMCCHGETGVRLDPANITHIAVDQLESSRSVLLEMFQRAQAVDFSRNVWAKCAGISLPDFLSRQMVALRTVMDRIANRAQGADATADDRIVPFNDKSPSPQQAHARAELAEQLAWLLPKTIEAGLAVLATKDQAAVAAMQSKIDGLEPSITLFRAGPLDADLVSFIQPPASGYRCSSESPPIPLCLASAPRSANSSPLAASRMQPHPMRRIPPPTFSKASNSQRHEPKRSNASKKNSPGLLFLPRPGRPILKPASATTSLPKKPPPH